MQYYKTIKFKTVGQYWGRGGGNCVGMQVRLTGMKEVDLQPINTKGYGNLHIYIPVDSAREFAEAILEAIK